MRQTISVLVENNPGVLSRVSGLFSRRGFNIESLAVSITEDPTISRMTILVDGEKIVVEQVTKQLNKLVDVIKVFDISKDSVMRELALIKVNASPEDKNEIIQIINIFKAKVVDLSRNYITIEITGKSEKITAIEELLRPFGIKEMVRTGTIGIHRENKTNKPCNIGLEESSKMEV